MTAQNRQTGGNRKLCRRTYRGKRSYETPSRLLEHVCERIAERLFHDFPVIEEIDIRLYKENPPMGADCQK